MTLLQKYAKFLPINEKTPHLTLGEGNTPLIYADRLSKDLSANIYLKIEGLNPTGSFKDRGMVLAVAKAKEKGAKAIICASTGNTSASAAAYAAKAGLKSFVVIPDGYVALGKLAQAMMYGTKIISIKGNFDQALSLVKKIGSNHPVEIVNSINPYRIEGQKTAAFEIIEQLNHAPDILSIPVGNAGNISAYWKGFSEACKAGLSSTRPNMWGFEASGAAAITHQKVINQPETLATAIRIGHPASWDLAERARDESQGLIDEVTDEDILHAYHYLAKNEAVFCEPASAASIAGLFKMLSNKRLPKRSTVVAVLTGNGLKDPGIAMEQIERPTPIEATEEALLKMMFEGD
ncbi:threonine synthase [Bacillaceae bacterium W0354]